MEGVALLSPRSISLLLSKYITVLFASGNTLSGYVIAVDPETKICTLWNSESNVGKVHLVFPHSMTRMEVNHNKCLSNPQLDDILLRLSSSQKNSADSAACVGDPNLVEGERKLHVMALLDRNHLPFVLENEQTVICVLGILYIDPPYTARSLRCANDIVLSRVTRLLEEYEANSEKVRELEQLEEEEFQKRQQRQQKQSVDSTLP
jgi:hypothetical protein